MARILVLALLAAAPLAGCTSGSSMSSMTTYGYAFAPPAFYEFCDRDAGLCASSGAQKEIALTPARLAQIKTVNDEVNASVRQVDDTGRNGDDWRVALDSGDCEDIALRKKKRLMALGFPASTLLLTVVRPRFGDDGHTVLTVITSEGDYVLDSLAPRVKLWNRTPYRYFARQSQDEHAIWERVR